MANSATGGMFSRDGGQLYYEVYGTSKSLLLTHTCLESDCFLIPPNSQHNRG